MAGHSKWANIKHRKGKADAQKGKIFSRVSKEIISAVKVGGPDPKGNTRLRLALLKARAANVPSENVERLIKKASSADQADYSEVTYELYGYGGVGMIIDIMTDNKNRTSSDIRIATNKRGGTIASPGAVAFNFESKGIIQIAKKAEIEDQLFLDAIEAGAEDFDASDSSIFVITTDPAQLYAVKDALTAKGYETSSAEQERIARTFVNCNKEDMEANLALIEWLENLDDVDAVYHNMELEE